MIIRKYLYELLGCDGMFAEEVLSKSNLSCSQLNLPFQTPHSAQEEQLLFITRTSKLLVNRLVYHSLEQHQMLHRFQREKYLSQALQAVKNYTAIIVHNKKRI